MTRIVRGKNRAVSIRVTIEADEIVRLLNERVAADPVRGTVLGTISIVLSGPDAEGWCAVTDDGQGLAVRSNREFPVVIHGRWPNEHRDALAELLLHLRDLVAVSGAADVVGQVSRRLPPARDRTQLRLFRLDRLTGVPNVSGIARRATRVDRDLVLAWYEAFAIEARGIGAGLERAVDEALAAGGCWLWLDDDEPVSLATRRPTIAGSARIDPVYTRPERRGRGYGSAVTAAATRDVLAEGAVPVLFTDLSNPTSNEIYQRLGYRPVEDRLELGLK